MKTKFLSALLGLALLAGFPSAGLAGGIDKQVSKEKASKLIQNWPQESQKAAQAMLDKYGAPDEYTASHFIWRDNGPWKRTVVYNEPVEHNFPMPHKDVLEQVIDFNVPADKFDELAAFDGSVIASRTNGELAARCDKEEANFLALNLAQDIIAGEKSVQKARDVYADSVRKMLGGQKVALMQNFDFEVSREDITNKDEAVIEKTAQQTTIDEADRAPASVESTEKESELKTESETVY